MGAIRQETGGGRRSDEAVNQAFFAPGFPGQREIESIIEFREATFPQCRFQAVKTEPMPAIPW